MADRNNTINYAEIFMPLLDAQVAQEATTGWMDANAGQVQYDGGNKVHIPKMALDGLADYSRTDGYARGAITLSYEEKTMTQDRGRQFFLDSMDINEANFVPSASLVMAEFQRLHVIPEVDAYRISKLAATAITVDKNVTYGYTPDKSTIVDALLDDIAKIRSRGFRNESFVVLARTAVTAALQKARADKGDTVAFTQSGIVSQVPAIDNNPIIEVDDARMVSAIEIVGGEAGGFDKGESGLDVNYIIMPVRTPIAVTKQNNMKVFAPEQVQNADGWLIDYRRYHDLWVLDNRAESIAVNIKDAKA